MLKEGKLEEDIHGRSILPKITPQAVRLMDPERFGQAIQRLCAQGMRASDAADLIVHWGSDVQVDSFHPGSGGGSNGSAKG